MVLEIPHLKKPPKWLRHGAHCANSVHFVFFPVRTGLHFALYAYEGHPEAKHVIVVMGSAAVTCGETASYLTKKGQKVGVLKARNVMYCIGCSSRLGDLFVAGLLNNCRCISMDGQAFFEVLW